MELLHLSDLKNGDSFTRGFVSDPLESEIENGKCINNEEIPFACSICGFGCSETIELDQHMMVHSQTAGLIECRSSLLDEKEQINSLNDKDHFQCSECKYKCSEKITLQHHMEAHHYLLYCKLCDKKFITRKAFYYHQKNNHEGEDLFICPLCNFQINKNSKILINAHRQGHSRDMGEHFKNYEHVFDNVTVGKIRAPGLKKFLCTICNAKFPYRSAMERHMMIHTGERPFSCEECGSKFKGHGNLHTHMLTHKERLYNCPQCDYKGANKVAIRRHMISHSDEKPFKCTECNTCYKRKQKLLEHNKKHHEKTFKCTECNSCFKRKHKLLEHIKKHHLE